jgi:hypothetical protein
MTLLCRGLTARLSGPPSSACHLPLADFVGLKPSLLLRGGGPPACQNLNLEIAISTTRTLSTIAEPQIALGHGA